jgi:two-component system sensor histidine kinase/response regulator
MTFESILLSNLRTNKWQILHHPKFPIVVLALSMFVTIIAWSVSSSMVQKNIEERFIRHTDDLAAAIESRLLTYETTLRGGAGLFKSAGYVNREQWRTYVRSLNIQQTMPGIQGIGFTQMLSSSQIDRHILDVRASGFTKYNIRPSGKRDPTSSIVYLEPFDWRNQRAFGYDMYSEPVRREAMIKAMETAQPAMSGRVNLVQETDEAKQHGFLVYVPVYRSNMPINTMAERRAAIHGFVYSPFRVGDLMAGIAGSKREGIHFELYDGDSESDAAFLYQSISPALLPVADEEPHLINRKIPITVVGRQWLVSAHVTESYGKTGEITVPTIVAVVGLIINLMLFLTFYALRRQQRQLEQRNASIAILSLAVEQSPHSIVITDLDGTVSYVNPAFSKTTGYAPEEIVGNNQRILQSGKTPESTYAELWDTVRRGERWQGRFINRRKDGSDYIDQTIIAPIRSEPDSRISHYLAIKEDISQQELTSQKLTNTEERLRLALQATREVIWDWNLLTDQQTWNETGAEIFGWQDIVSEPQSAAWWIERVHPDDRERLATEFHRVIEDSSLDSWQDEYRFRRSDDTYAQVLDRGLVVRDLNGKPVRMVGSMLDISELTRARQLLEIQQTHLEHIVAERTAELKSSEQRIKLILASTADGIIGTDRIGVINFVNPAAENLLGYPNGALIGLSIMHTILHRHAGELCEDTPNQSLHHGENNFSNIEETFWRADGEALPVEYSYRTIIECGEELGFVFGFTDIRTRKAAELARKKALTEAERLAHIKSEFLANMSHEIRTPLNAVIASAMLMENDTVKPKQRERLTRIIDSSQHLLRLISDILDFSKIDAGRIEIETTDFKLRSVFDLVASQSVEIATRKGIEWRTSIDPKLPVSLLGDSMRLGQILLNFSSNALKFTERGHVTLNARLLEEGADNLLVRFEVLDSGRGFDTTRTDTLFEAFMQEDSSTTREFGGTGLGLAISKKITELMRGRIGAESKPDSGSTFWVEIPFKRSVKSNFPDTTQSSLNGKRAIILGRDEVRAGGIQAQLSRLKIGAQHASTVAELVTRVETACRVKLPYDVLLCVGEKDEIAAICEPEFQKRLHNLTQQTPLRCIAMAAQADRQFLDSPLKRGCFDALLPLELSDPEVERLLNKLLASAPDSGVQAVSPAVGSTFDLRSFGKCRILLAEDNPINQAVALDMLDSFGLTADIAHNGQEALILAENRPYHLILMDMQMPVMGGLEATREIRRLPGYEAVPIIALTANAFESDRQACLAVGMSDFLGKPVVPDSLQRTLRQWLNESTVQSPNEAMELDQTLANSCGIADADLPEIPGVNLKMGLEQMSGKRSTLLRLLGKLIETHGQDVETIRNKLAAGDLEGICRVAHSLKGSAGMLGAEAIAASASGIEKIVHESHSFDEIETQLSELDRHFNSIQNALKVISR